MTFGQGEPLWNKMEQLSPGGAAGYGTFADEPVVHEGSRAVHVRGQMAIGLAGHHGWLRL